MNSAEIQNDDKDLRDLTVRSTKFETQNGRVAFGPNIGAGGSFTDVPGFTHEKQVEANFIDDMLRGNWEQNALSRSFFSPENITNIQNLIRKGVYEKSGSKKYIIDDQSVDELKIIMRGIFYQYARNLDTNIKEQIKDLNTKVIDWSIPHILSAVDHYHYYINDISHLPVPMQSPQNLSRAGTKSLPTNPFV